MNEVEVLRLTSRYSQDYQTNAPKYFLQVCIWTVQWKLSKVHGRLNHEKQRILLMSSRTPIAGQFHQYRSTHSRVESIMLCCFTDEASLHSNEKWHRIDFEAFWQRQERAANWRSGVMVRHSIVACVIRYLNGAVQESVQRRTVYSSCVVFQAAKWIKLKKPIIISHTNVRRATS